jgi:hypothetical protein
VDFAECALAICSAAGIGCRKVNAPESSGLFDELDAVAVHAGSGVGLTHHFHSCFQFVIVSYFQDGSDRNLSWEHDDCAVIVQVGGFSTNSKFLAVLIVPAYTDGL